MCDEVDEEKASKFKPKRARRPTYGLKEEKFHAFIPSFNEMFPSQCEILPKEIKDKAWVCGKA
jgi:hypothetical protein